MNSFTVPDWLDEEGEGVAVAGVLQSPAAVVSCSICLDTVIDGEKRSIVKLQCGHQFHLDCIGSAFNAKGIMQCPNCRKVEKGNWLYASGFQPIPDFNMDDWMHDEDLNDLNYPEMPFGVHWPFSRLAQVPLPSVESQFLMPSTHHDFQGQLSVITDHQAATSNFHHQSWGSLPPNTRDTGAEQASVSFSYAGSERVDSNTQTRPTSSVRASSSSEMSSMAPHFDGNSRGYSHEHQQTLSMRGPIPSDVGGSARNRALAPLEPALPPTEHAGIFVLSPFAIRAAQDTEIGGESQFHARERDSRHPRRIVRRRSGRR